MRSESGAKPATEYPGVIVTKKDLLKLAKQYLISSDDLSTTHLIRRIQLAEGNFDCFATVRVFACQQFQCRWRKDCLHEAAAFSAAES